jgi:branched-chain amino acid transport system ATP-binding protein
VTARLATHGLTGGRGQTVVFRSLDLEVGAGRVLTLLGPNGAGKTTLLLTLAGLLPWQDGSVEVDGVAVHCGRPSQANKAGIVLVPDDRCLFTTLTTEQNLEVAKRRGGPAPKDLLDVFPALERRWKINAGALSGGEQQMLVLARALIQEPKVLLVDEMSMGLAPMVVEQLFGAVRKIAADHDTAIVLVEQHVNLALEVADDAIVLNRGTIVLRDAAAALVGDARVEAAYFGESELVGTEPPAAS